MLHDYQKNVLKLLSSSLFGTSFDFSGITDWTSIFAECEKQTVTAIVAQSIPAEAENQILWEQSVIKTNARYMKLEYAHCELHELLAGNHIQYISMKGCASAHYYPAPMLRLMGDVDFLVEKEDVKRTKELLLQNGFSKVDYQNMHHYEFVKDGIVYELHHEVNGLPGGNQKKITEKYLANMIGMGRELETDYGTIMIPDRFYHGLILLLHTAKHMTSSGLGLRHLCDWCVFVNSVSDFTELFQKPLQEMGLWRFATQLTDVCCKYLLLPRRSWMKEWPDSLSEAIMEDILEAGNFGKEKEQTKDFWLINSNAGQSSNMFFQLARTANRVTLQNWPWVMKCKFILPVGWFYFGMRYIMEVFAGKKKRINLIKMVSSASKRRKLYSLFRLFDSE